MKILVTGGAGFIGSSVVRAGVACGFNMINVDCLTYAANLQNLKVVEGSPLYSFEKVDICDATAVQYLFEKHNPDAVMHLAAESHVDRSIDSPGAFMRTNVIGTFNLLQSTRQHWEQLPAHKKDEFRFHHVSTDEVYGDLEMDDPAFTETTPYDPSSPYSASKASSDHLVRAWARTYGLPVLITNCSNNYGPFQFPEKLIPVVILKALHKDSIPVYGKGDNIRDWLYVDDHVEALFTVLHKGKLGETYNIGGNNERKNLELVKSICSLMDQHIGGKFSHKSLIKFVQDRPGHDRRYAINASKINNDLGWTPSMSWDEGFEKTIQWYADNEWWWRPLVTTGTFGARIGTNMVAK